MGPVGDTIAVIVIEGLVMFLCVYAWIGWKRNSSLLVTRTERAFTLSTLLLASFSGLLQVGSAIYAQFHHFPFLDPTLMLIYGIGLASAALGFIASALAAGPARNRSVALCVVAGFIWLMSALSE